MWWLSLPVLKLLVGRVGDNSKYPREKQESELGGLDWTGLLEYWNGSNTDNKECMAPIETQ